MIKKGNLRASAFALTAAAAATAFLAVFCPSSVSAVEIPISAVSDGKSVRIAYADMELIYNVCPQKARASKEYRQAKDGYEIRISSLVAALDLRRGSLERMKSEEMELKRAAEEAAAASTVTARSAVSAGAVESAYEKELLKKGLETEIAGLEKDLVSLRAEMDEALRAVEKECSLKILEEIYKVLEQIAAEEELLVVIDKNYVLYASDTYDITPKVIERLKLK